MVHHHLPQGITLSPDAKAEEQGISIEGWTSIEVQPSRNIFHWIAHQLKREVFPMEGELPRES